MNQCKNLRQLSCDELGVCQERYFRCGGCLASHDTARMTAPMATGPQPRLRLAPGVVEGYRVGFFGSAQQRRELRRWAAVSVWLLAIVTLVSVAVGLVVGVTA